MNKNTCPHCGSWGELSRFCSRCGNSIIYKDIETGQKEFHEKTIAKSTQIRDSIIVICVAMCLCLVVLMLLAL
jgi:DNA-directed RNA polymerase subunit RPC12/RpoP